MINTQNQKAGDNCDTLWGRTSLARQQALSALLGEGHPAPDATFDPATHLAVLPYSSGTTGRPKGVKPRLGR